MSAFGVVGEMDDFQRVVVGIVEIGAAAGEDALLALILAEDVDAPGLELGYRRVVGVAIDHEGVVDDVGEPPAAGIAAEYDIVVAGFEKHEVGVLLRHLADEFEPEDVGIEHPAARGIADRNGEVQDAFGLDHARTSAAATPSHGKLRRSLEKISPPINTRRRKVPCRLQRLTAAHLVWWLLDARFRGHDSAGRMVKECSTAAAARSRRAGSGTRAPSRLGSVRRCAAR